MCFPPKKLFISVYTVRRRRNLLCKFFFFGVCLIGLDDGVFLGCIYKFGSIHTYSRMMMTIMVFLNEFEVFERTRVWGDRILRI